MVHDTLIALLLYHMPFALSNMKLKALPPNSNITHFYTCNSLLIYIFITVNLLFLSR
jgi:hypothetical protein